VVDETSPPSFAEIDFTENFTDQHVSVTLKASYLSIVFLNRSKPTLETRAKFTVIVVPTMISIVRRCRDLVGGNSVIIVLAIRSSFIYATFLWFSKHAHHRICRIRCPQSYPCFILCTSFDIMLNATINLVSF